MQHVVRALVLALVAGLLAVTPAAALATPSGSSVPTPTLDAADYPAALSSAKVVIIVGPVQAKTANYRAMADEAYAEAIKYSSNVVRVYSPNATWAAVKAELQGANVVLYLGHGNGWPSPYPYDPNFTTRNGFGLNATATSGDSITKYYGEPYIRNEIRLAPNAVVLLNHLCYAAGSSEPGFPAPTLSVAMQRVDNFASAFLKAGARAVIAEGTGSVNGMIRDLFTTSQTIVDLWRTQYDYNGNELSFPSTRSPGYTAYMDPDGTPNGYYRSVVGSPDLRTVDVTGAPFSSVPQAITPPPPVGPVDPGTVSRLAGANRYETAAAIAAGYAPGVPVAYIATGLNYPDALTGAAAAGVTGGPVLLVTRDAIPAATAAELARLTPGRIVILGGEGVVSDAVVASLTVFTTGGVTRLAGENRYATAAAISAATYAPGVPVAYVATGLDFPDALAGAAVAGSEGAPLLLVTRGAVPAATAAELARLRPARIVLFGTPDSVSDAVLATLGGATTGGVSRVAGTDRYSTAAAISAAANNPGVAVAYVATGLDFPDALAGAALAAPDPRTAPPRHAGRPARRRRRRAGQAPAGPDRHPRRVGRRRRRGSGPAPDLHRRLRLRACW